MLGEGVVARVVRRHCHDGSRAVSGEYILRNPHGNIVAREGIDGIRAGEDTRDGVVGHAVELGALLHVGEVLIDGSLLFGLCQFFHQLALGSQYHECNAENSVCTSREDGEFDVAVFDGELHFRSFGASYPVALCLLYAVAPLHGVESVEQTLRVCRCAQAPLLHLLLHHGVAAAFAHAVHHLVVGEHRAQSGAPVHHRLAEIGYAVVHQHLLFLYVVVGVPLVGGELEVLAFSHVYAAGAFLFEVLHELFYGLCLLASVAEERPEHLFKSPLCPVVVFGVAGAHLTVPVKGKAYVVELLPVARYVGLCCHLGVLSCLYGILLGGQAVGVVAHGVEHVVAVLPLVARVDVAGYIA